MASFIYAHSVKDKDPEHWELLIDHASRVAMAASANARPFSNELAALAGWLHDLGKLKPRFQRRLQDPTVVEPHAAEGARYAFENCPTFFGALLAQIVLGHHAGLDDGERSGRSLWTRLKDAEQLMPPADWPITRLGTVPKALTGLNNMGEDAQKYARHFLGRMVFSALVDADHTETAGFYAEIEGKLAQGHSPDLMLLRNRLDNFMGSKDSNRPIDVLRRGIHTNVRDGATLYPGLFSLTVPTGGGKTLSSLGFALEHAIQHGMDQIIFVIPYMSIVEQTAAVFREVFGDLGADVVLEHHSSFDWGEVKGDDEMAALKTAVDRWDRPVVVTTAVQFFESLHAGRPSRCRKLHRMANSVIVLDEAQTLPLHLLRPSLAALKELARGYGSSVVFCTATQPALSKDDGFPYQEGLEEVRELAPDPVGLYEQLKRVEVRQGGMMDNAALAQALSEDTGGLVILNNRRQARAVFEKIAHLPHAYHLSTNMTARHRRAVLEDIRRDLAAGHSARVVSTSLIEAGVDISFPIVYRALAGLDSIAQAAGRCNREARLEGLGRVVVFDPEPGEAGEYAPPASLRLLADAARQVIADHSDDPLSLDAIRDYFSKIYWNQSHGMDNGIVEGAHYPILEHIHAALPRAAPVFPYGSISEAYQIIPGGTRPVVIRGGAWGVSEDELQGLDFTPSAGGVARALQSYQVQVPTAVTGRMRGDGLLGCYREGDFGEQFLMLDMPSLYDERSGLRWDNYSDLGTLLVF